MLILFIIITYLGPEVPHMDPDLIIPDNIIDWIKEKEII